MFWKKWFSKSKSVDDIEDVKAVIVTDIGSVRTNNEDSVSFLRPSKKNARMGYLGVVADGMGGHKAGEVASSLTIKAVTREYYKKSESPLTSIRNAVIKANEEVWAKAKGNPALKNMGTTCTAIAIVNKTLYMAHIGDSRLYHLKSGILSQHSKDHTYVQELVDQGVIAQKEAGSHPERNILTRALGTKSNTRVDARKIDVSFDEGDRLLLCTDGLYDYFSNNEIQEYLTKDKIGEAANNLVNTAKMRGGHDNITVLIIEKIKNNVGRELRETGEINLE